jgi:hypothetical protein
MLGQLDHGHAALLTHAAQLIAKTLDKQDRIHLVTYM